MYCPLVSVSHTSQIHSSLLWDLRGAISTNFFDTQVPSASKGLVLFHHARFVLYRQQRKQFYFISLESAQLRIHRAAPEVVRLGTLFISFCSVLQQTLYAACSVATLIYLKCQVQALRSCQDFGTPWSSAMHPSRERGRVANNNKQRPFICLQDQL